MPTPSLLLQAQQAGPKSQPSGDSPLSFASSNTFREELMLKNLKPYNFVGLNPEQQGSVIYQQTLPDLSSHEVLFTSSDKFLIYRNDNPGNLIVPSSQIVNLKIAPSNIPESFSPFKKATSRMKRILAPFTADTKFKNFLFGLKFPITGSLTSSVF